MEMALNPIPSMYILSPRACLPGPVISADLGPLVSEVQRDIGTRWDVKGDCTSRA